MSVWHKNLYSIHWIFRLSLEILYLQTIFIFIQRYIYINSSLVFLFTSTFAFVSKTATEISSRPRKISILSKLCQVTLRFIRHNATTSSCSVTKLIWSMKAGVCTGNGSNQVEFGIFTEQKHVASQHDRVVWECTLNYPFFATTQHTGLVWLHRSFNSK